MTTIINASNSSGLTLTSDMSGSLAVQTLGVSAITVDTVGRVGTPLQPRFFGYRSAGNVTAPNNVVHDTVIVNVGSCYNSTTGIFTCPIAGYYEVIAGGHGENTTVVSILINKNGSGIVEEYSNGPAYGSVTAIAILSCAANDIITSSVATGTMWGGNRSGLRMSVKYLG